MPVTRVFGSPALNVSTVGVVHGTPTWLRMRSITSAAVRGWPLAAVSPARSAANAMTNRRAARRAMILVRRTSGCLRHNAYHHRRMAGNHGRVRALHHAHILRGPQIADRGTQRRRVSDVRPGY